MTMIELREPPARPASGRRPIMPLDKQIMEITGDTPMRPITIAQALRRQGEYGNISTQRVASRLKSLVNRDMMVRIRPTGGPRNGPGTSYYRVKPTGDSATDE
jgi:hypothetical protein